MKCTHSCVLHAPVMLLSGSWPLPCQAMRAAFTVLNLPDSTCGALPGMPGSYSHWSTSCIVTTFGCLSISWVLR